MLALFVIVIIVVVILFILYSIGWFDRFVYFLVSILLTIVILGRVACETLSCFFEPFKIFLSSLFHFRHTPCKDCKADWSLRGGIDEAGLILTGVFVFVQVLFIKNIKIRDLIRNISKINLLGALETEILDKKVSDYSKDELKFIDNDIIKRFEKIEDKLIEKANTVDERLLLLNRAINEILRELHEKSMLKQEAKQTIIDFEIIIKSLEEKTILDPRLIKHIKEFNTIIYTNAFRLNGRRSNSLNIIGSKILKILLVRKKLFFLTNKILYPDIDSISIRKQESIPSKKGGEFSTEASILIKDINGNIFPLSTLSENNFIIEESLGFRKYKIKPDKVIRLYQGKINLNLILMIDCSTSMKTENKIEKGKLAAIDFLKRIKKLDSINCKVALYRISSVNQGFIHQDWLLIDDHLENLIKNLQPGGNTPLFSSLSEAIKKAKSMNNNDRNMIVCLTDGKSEGEKIKLEEISKDVKITQIPIISIGFGEEDYSAMKHISSLSGAGENGKGYFIRAKPEDISKVFEELAMSIASMYQISWTSKIGNQKDVRLKIVVTFKDEDGKKHRDVFEVTEPL